MNSDTEKAIISDHFKLKIFCVCVPCLNAILKLALSHYLPLYVQVQWEETRFCTADPPEDDDPRLECGPDPWNFAAQTNWEGDDDGYPV
ncbi:hypothetical protein CEXT_617121 [Caerostris extrusa]|uniref:Uncharacterized protein n=1 Tax=Caerostris extrusa TaxID=172846 RepID=A0AAV4XQC5_CAEEX|nr:hypothetical protein CEXT_617121 [Caerostris extrusa]